MTNPPAPNRVPNLLRRTILSLRRAASLLRRSSLGPTARRGCSSLQWPGRVGLARDAQPVWCSRGFALGAACLALLGCEDIQSQFVGSRVLDPCDRTWNVCATRVGCFLGDRSYVEGRFPGTNRVGIQLFEPSTVTVSFLPSEIAGTGLTTAITFYEGSCTTPERVEVTGTTFIGEAETAGYVSRQANLMGVGDHLIQVESDARTKYLMKIDVLALRLQQSSAQ